MKTRILISILFPILSAHSQQATPQQAQAVKDYLGHSRDLLNKYYEMSKALSKEEADWKLGREMLTSRVELMEAQLKELVTKTAEENRNISQNDEERSKLEKQNQELLAAQDLQIVSVEKLESRVRSLWPLLPELLQTKVKGQYDRLPEAGKKREDVKAGVGERFLNVLAVLNEVNKFHSDITITNERRKLKSGQELEVRVIYFGLAAAYFAGSAEVGNVAGMLVPGASGWEVVEMPEIAPMVNDVIAMNKSEKIAGFVPLPVKVR
jgi:hypothetical protein